MKRALWMLAISVATGFFAATTVLGTEEIAAARTCGPCGKGSLKQECTTGTCQGGKDTVDGSTDCQYACCYGAGNTLCGSSDSLDIDGESPPPRP